MRHFANKPKYISTKLHTTNVLKSGTSGVTYPWTRERFCRH